MTKQIKFKLLISLECAEAQDFEEVSGDVDEDLSVETAVKYAAVFNWSCAARNLLSKKNFKLFDAAEEVSMEAYEDALYVKVNVGDRQEIVKEARKVYNEQTAKKFAELYLAQ